MATLQEYLQTIYGPTGKAPGFGLADLALQEGDLTSEHNLGGRVLDVAGQRLGLDAKQNLLDRNSLVYDRKDIGLAQKGFGIDKKDHGLQRQGIQAVMNRANRDFKFDQRDLQSAFGAKGTFHSGARRTGEQRLGNTLSDLMQDQKRALSGIGLNEQRTGLQQTGATYDLARLGIQGQGLQLDKQGIALNQKDLGLDREQNDLTLASGLGRIQNQKIQVANGV